MVAITTAGYGQTFFSMMGKGTTPYAGYAKFIAANKSGGGTLTLSPDGLTVQANGSVSVYTNIGVSSSSPNPRIYYEIKTVTLSAYGIWGVAPAGASYLASNAWGARNDVSPGPYKTNNGTFTAFGARILANDIISYAIDMVAGTIYYFRNGVMQGGTVMFTGLTGTLYPLNTEGGGGIVDNIYNFGQNPLIYYNTITIGGSSLASLGYIPGLYQ